MLRFNYKLHSLRHFDSTFTNHSLHCCRSRQRATTVVKHTRDYIGNDMVFTNWHGMAVMSTATTVYTVGVEGGD